MASSRYGKSVFTVIALVLIAQVGAICVADESPSRERHVRFSYVTEIGPIDPSAQSLKIWIPLPREDAFQHVTGISVESALPSRIVDQKSDGNRLVFIEAKGRLPQTIVVKLTADVVRRQESADLRKAAAGRAEPADGAFAEYVRPDALVPTTGRIAKVSAQLDDGSATPFEEARIIYEYVTSVMRYDKTGTGWGRGDAIYACDVRRGNCTDFRAGAIARHTCPLHNRVSARHGSLRQDPRLSLLG